MKRVLIPLFLLISIYSCRETTSHSESDGDKIPSQDNENYLDIESFDIDHPLWDENYERNYDVNDLEQMLHVSSLYEDSIDLVIKSFNKNLEESKCLDFETKKKLRNGLDSLVLTHSSYVYWAQTCEVISYREGKAAGRNSLDYQIYLNQKFLDYLKHLTNSIYFSYLEPGVFPCE